MTRRHTYGTDEVGDAELRAAIQRRIGELNEHIATIPPQRRAALERIADVLMAPLVQRAEAIASARNPGQTAADNIEAVLKRSSEWGGGHGRPQ